MKTCHEMTMELLREEEARERLRKLKLDNDVRRDALEHKSFHQSEERWQSLRGATR